MHTVHTDRAEIDVEILMVYRRCCVIGLMVKYQYRLWEIYRSNRLVVWTNSLEKYFFIREIIGVNIQCRQII